jgi:hypothetical protein
MSVIETEAADVVWGAEAIGAVIHRNPRQTFYLLEAGKLPAKKIGRQWIASRKRLLAAVIGEGPAA